MMIKRSLVQSSLGTIFWLNLFLICKKPVFAMLSALCNLEECVTSCAAAFYVVNHSQHTFLTGLLDMTDLEVDFYSLLLFA